MELRIALSGDGADAAALGTWLRESPELRAAVRWDHAAAPGTMAAEAGAVLVGALALGKDVLPVLLQSLSAYVTERARWGRAQFRVHLTGPGGEITVEATNLADLTVADYERLLEAAQRAQSQLR